MSSEKATASIPAFDKREHDRKTQQNKRHQQKEYIRSLQEQRDSLLEDRITMMKLLKRNKQLEDEKAQLEGKLSTLQREEMVQLHTLGFDIANMHWDITYQ